MKNFLLLMAVVLGSFAMKAQVTIPYQEISYNINYHWGVIDVMIARGTVTASSNNGQFYGTLNGSSIPWEGRVFCVSDTLQANMNINGGVWQENVQYQNGWYRRPLVSEYRSASYNPDAPDAYRNIAGQGGYPASPDTMEAVTVTSDMLGMYYYAHAIDFSVLNPGNQLTVNIDGPYSRSLVITYQGQGTYSGNGNTYPTYNCTFEYSYDGAMSGYPVECRIGVNNRIPLFLSANLPIGRIEMLYSE